MYDLYWKEICRCIELSNAFYGTPYRLCKERFVPITSPRYVKTCRLFYSLLWIQTGLMYLALLHVSFKGESKNHLLVSIGIVMYYTTAANVGLSCKNMECTRETTLLLNSWMQFQRNLTDYGPTLEGTYSQHLHSALQI
jgi:hypothetical protein